jgi:hypothetical protein
MSRKTSQIWYSFSTDGLPFPNFQSGSSLDNFFAQEASDFLALKVWKFCHYSQTIRKSNCIALIENMIELGDFQEVIDILEQKSGSKGTVNDGIEINRIAHFLLLSCLQNLPDVLYYTRWIYENAYL